MKKVRNFVYSLAGVLCVFTVPGNAAILGFSSSSVVGTISTAAAPPAGVDPVTVLSGIAYTAVNVVGGSTYYLTTTGLAGGAADVFVTYNGSNQLVMQVGGSNLAGVFSNITAGTVLETINLSAPLTATIGSGSGAPFSLTNPSVSSIVSNATFLLDLGFYNPTTFLSMGVSAIESGTTGNFTDQSNTLSLLVSTPEPSSYLLLGSGLIAAGFMRRRKLFGTK